VGPPRPPLAREGGRNRAFSRRGSGLCRSLRWRRLLLLLLLLLLPPPLPLPLAPLPLPLAPLLLPLAPLLLLLCVVKSPEEGPAAQRWVPQGASFAPRISPLTSRHLHVLLFSGGRRGMQGG